MAPKRPNPKEEPPAASSSEDEHSSSAEEDEEGSSTEEEEEDDEQAAPPDITQKNPPPEPDTKTLAAAPACDEHSSSAEEDEEGSSEEEEEEDDEQAAPPATTQNNPPPKPDTKTLVAAPARTEEPQSSDSESETESDSDAPPSVNVKPIVTKPVEEAPKATKSRSKPAPPPATSPAKRPRASEQGQREAKRAKKKEDGPSETANKPLFQRIWSEEDEIAMLKGMLDYSKMKGADPLTQIGEFHEFIKESLHVDVSRAQLVDKIKRLKKKYNNSLGKGKKGEDRTFSKPHEQKSFDLSKKIWGNEGLVLALESSTVSNVKARKNQNQKGNKKALEAEPISSQDGNKPSESIKHEKEWSLSQCSSKLNLLDKRAGVGGLEEEISKQVMDVIDEAKKAELEKKWRDLQIGELELFLERHALIGEQAKLLLARYKSLNE